MAMASFPRPHASSNQKAQQERCVDAKRIARIHRGGDDPHQHLILGGSWFLHFSHLHRV
jgi:hypothetical protein